MAQLSGHRVDIDFKVLRRSCREHTRDTDSIF
jgi:hypothetical protein